MNDHKHPPGPLFGAEHASRYGSTHPAYLAMHDLIAATMADELKGRDDATLLFVGLGTGLEVLPYAKHGGPAWRFTGVDTSPHMLAKARERLAHAWLLDRTQLHEGALESLPTGALFDGAQMVGVLHHLDGDEARTGFLRELHRRLRPGAPFFVGESASHVDDVLLQLFQRSGFTAPRELPASAPFKILLVHSADARHV